MSSLSANRTAKALRLADALADHLPNLLRMEAHTIQAVVWQISDDTWRDLGGVPSNETKDAIVAAMRHRAGVA